jgi:hypothetical protein
MLTPEIVSVTTNGTSAAPRATAPDRARGIEGLYATAHWLLSTDRPIDAASVFRAMVLLARTDERGWLGLGTCHEAVDQPGLALELYGTAQVLLPRAVRCRLARARLLRAVGRDDEADDTLEGAQELAEEIGDETLIAMTVAERLAARTP